MKFCTIILWKLAKQTRYNSTSQKLPKSHKLNHNFQILTILYKENVLLVAVVTDRRGGHGIKDKQNLIIVERNERNI